MSIIKYTIVENSNIRHMIEEVNKHLAEGWTLYGSVAVSDEYGYVQALTREEGQ